jgi:hypothetical protein
MENKNNAVKRLMWSGLQAALGVLTGIVVQRMAVIVWRRVFDEEPPE